ncbi:hypothetical protein EVG20_g5390 [Dentipellis fragilis]|uniref:Monopolin complex subunit Csm1/Pcs1 C-terminal domain-containing protein n=1 Tax=Dentipellis fragilis TaxID=205917 RepID=A0A4Y9YU49_9AGAM|nr:hypothetical protein EVG20_g5390 [Dentipellis fragilis]
MSDIDEIEGFDPTTPYKPLAKKRKAADSNGAIAGPSKPTSSAKANKRKNAQPSPETLPGTEGEDHEDQSEHSVEEADVPVKAVGPPPKNKAKKPPSKAVTNGKVPPKSKAKAKADPPPPTAAKPAPVQRDETIENSEEETREREPRPETARSVADLPALPKNLGKRKDLAPPVRTNEGGPSQREVDRLKKQLQDVTAQRDALAGQVKEWAVLRETEVEMTLDMERRQSEATVNAKDQLIQELTHRTDVEPMIGSGRTSTLHFLTQEAADEAKVVVEREVDRLRGIIKEKDNVIAQKDAKIHQVEQAGKSYVFELANARFELQQPIPVAEKTMELKLEIKRCEDLQNKLSRDPPPSGLRGRAAPDAAHNDPKNGSAISLYEDMTNLLITNLRFEKSDFPDFDNEVFSCIFTHNETKASLSFTLQRLWSLRDPEHPPARIKSKDQLAMTMKYTPQDLEKESAEFREKIEFLSDVFTFAGEQVDVFFNSMREYLGNINRDNEPIVVEDDDD